MTPLFGSIPGGVELKLIGVVHLVVLFVGAWVYRDAVRRDNGAAALWALAVGVAGPVGAVVVGLLYAVAGRDHPPPDPEERYGGRE